MLFSSKALISFPETPSSLKFFKAKAYVLKECPLARMESFYGESMVLSFT